MRVLERLDELYAIGGGPGANRPHRSPGEDEAHALVAEWMREAGLAVEVDAHGNLLGRSGTRDDVWVGSHLDSVPQGGRFDGPLGVVGGLEAVERVGCGSVVAFRGEEVGCIGSRALCAGATALPAAFLELHIEQGPFSSGPEPTRGGDEHRRLCTWRARLRRSGGSRRNDAHGSARRCARCGAEAILRIRDAASRIDGAVATVGQLTVEPGGSNVIPERARISVDARAPDDGRLDELLAALGFEPGHRTPPATMGEELRRALLDEIERRGLPAIELPSGAGHDAGILAAAGVPSAMLFVRSLNGGISHSPDELSSEEDIALAVDVLARASNGSLVTTRLPSNSLLQGALGGSISDSGGLEELDRIAGGILDEDLLSARAGDDVVSEGRPRPAQLVGHRFDVLDLDHEPVPTAGLGLPSVRHRSGGRRLSPLNQSERSSRSTIANAGPICWARVNPSLPT